jgi:hypothetical protein
MTDSDSRITSLHFVSEQSIRLLAILAMTLLLCFLWTGVAQTQPIQENPLRAGKIVSGTSITVLKHEEEKKQASIRKTAHAKHRSSRIEPAGKDRIKDGKDRKILSGKKTDGNKEKKILVSRKGRPEKHARELSQIPGHHGKSKPDSISGHNRHNTLIALGRNYRSQKHTVELSQVSRRNIRVHARSQPDSTSPSIDQKEAFEKQLLMEEPLDEKTLNIIESAYSCKGIPYQWGGTTPDGFDCSGFIRYVFKENGIPLGRSSREQVQEGKSIPISELRPGDLVFFKFYSSRNRERNKGRVNHVGLYLGKGRFIHAASNSDDRAITVNELGSGEYFHRIVEVRRILDISADQ